MAGNTVAAIVRGAASVAKRSLESMPLGRRAYFYAEATLYTLLSSLNIATAALLAAFPANLHTEKGQIYLLAIDSVDNLPQMSLEAIKHVQVFLHDHDFDPDFLKQLNLTSKNCFVFDIAKCTMLASLGKSVMHLKHSILFDNTVNELLHYKALGFSPKILPGANSLLSQIDKMMPLTHGDSIDSLLIINCKSATPKIPHFDWKRTTVLVNATMDMSHHLYHYGYPADIPCAVIAFPSSPIRILGTLQTVPEQLRRVNVSVKERLTTWVVGDAITLLSANEFKSSLSDFYGFPVDFDQDSQLLQTSTKSNFDLPVTDFRRRIMAENSPSKGVLQCNPFSPQIPDDLMEDLKEHRSKSRLSSRREDFSETTAINLFEDLNLVQLEPTVVPELVLELDETSLIGEQFRDLSSEYRLVG